MARFGAGATVYRATWGPACDSTLSPRRSCHLCSTGASARVIHVSCTRGQARPKRNGSQRSFASGQGGQDPSRHDRRRAVDCGRLPQGTGRRPHRQDSGTTGSDHLTFYRSVGAQRVDTQEAVLRGGYGPTTHCWLLGAWAWRTRLHSVLMSYRLSLRSESSAAALPHPLPACRRMATHLHGDAVLMGELGSQLYSAARGAKRRLK